MAHQQYDPKRILAPVDLSELSPETLRAALSVAANRDARVTVLHVMQPIQDLAADNPELFGKIPVDKILASIKSEAEHRLQTLLVDAGADDRVERSLEWGRASEVILSVAESGNFGLIVIATHGRAGIKRFLIGSVAEQVIRHAHCPLLVIRLKEKAEAAGGARSTVFERYDPNKILVPVDFSAASMQALRAATTIGVNRDAPVTVLHVMEKPRIFDTGPFGPKERFVEQSRAESDKQLRDVTAKMEGLLADIETSPNFDSLVRWGPAAEEIISVADAGRYELIVMATRGQTGLTRFLMGSVAERVIRHAPCPVLAVRA